MSELKIQNRRYINRRAKSGQALIIVLAVMFVLIFIGTIFIAQVGHNIQQSGRSVQSQVANTLAEAGIRYCDVQLTNSGDGADWRPTPTPPITLTDPDYQWLSQGYSRVAMNGGRALVRVVYAPNSNDPRGGLLRIEAIGRPGDIGNGTDPTLFVQTGAAPRLRKEIVGYKQIGLTDYGLFVTNLHKTNAEAAVGAPSLGVAGTLGANGIAATGVPLSLVLGDPTVGKNTNPNTPSFPMRFNSDVKFYGNTYLYESQRGTGDNLLTQDKLLTSGNVLFDSRDTRVFVNQDIINPMPPASFASNLLQIGGGTTNVNCEANPSSANADCAYNGAGGLVLTGSAQPDAQGYSQGIRSLTPPSLDYRDAGTGILRYRLLTRETGVWGTDTSGTRYRTGQDGWGTGIYVNNPSDYQAETNAAGIASSYSLRADWLSPKSNFAHFWQGPTYRPPGVLIELLGDRLRLTRDDNDSFYEPDGSQSVLQGGKSIEIPFSDFERKAYVLPNGITLQNSNPARPALPAFSHDGDERDAYFTDPTRKSGLNNPYTHNDTYGVNVVLMAEGNVRVRGVYGVDAGKTGNAGAVAEAAGTETELETTIGSKRLERVHLTIMSGHTAYIEGNIVKGDPDKASTCAILAHDYVCVNPTVFMAPQNQTNAWIPSSENLGSFFQEIGGGVASSSSDMSFSFGINPNLYGKPVNLLMRHAAANAGLALLNLRINPALSLSNLPAIPNAGFYDFTKSFFDAAAPAMTDTLNIQTYGTNGVPFIGTTIFPNTYLLGLFMTGGINSISLPNFEERGFQLDTGNTGNYSLITAPGYENLLSFSVDSTTPGQTGPGSVTNGSMANYAFGGAAVTPLDIRIEAVLYAQERSFFVIPGYPFNPDPLDTAQTYLHRGNARPSLGILLANNTLSNISRVATDFPFYNEPLDVRITIFGAVTENYTASINDQAAWMARWGYIPVYPGAAGIANTANNNTAYNSIPLIHQQGIDPNTATPADYRTADEVTAGIAHGMRFQYDPSLAFPYAQYVKGLNPPTGVGNAIPAVPALQPLRFNLQPLYDMAGGTVKKQYIQALPPVPKLPVCPGLLYMGTPDHPL